jgi:hypothetical protein
MSMTNISAPVMWHYRRVTRLRLVPATQNARPVNATEKGEVAAFKNVRNQWRLPGDNEYEKRDKCGSSW